VDLSLRIPARVTRELWCRVGADPKTTGEPQVMT
jgi:hypothetical protein